MFRTPFWQRIDDGFFISRSRVRLLKMFRDDNGNATSRKKNSVGQKKKQTNKLITSSTIEERIASLHFGFGRQRGRYRSAQTSKREKWPAKKHSVGGVQTRRSGQSSVSFHRSLVDFVSPYLGRRWRSPSDWCWRRWWRWRRRRRRWRRSAASAAPAAANSRPTLASSSSTGAILSTPDVSRLSDRPTWVSNWSFSSLSIWKKKQNLFLCERFVFPLVAKLDW